MNCYRMSSRVVLASVAALVVTLLAPFSALAYDGESPSPNYINVPPAPPTIVVCGPENDTWEQPRNDEVLVWRQTDARELIVSPVEPNTLFVENNLPEYNYGVAPDSNTPCDKVIQIPTFKVNDPCGPRNAEYVLPNDTRVPYSIVRHDNRSVTVTAEAGFIFANGNKTVVLDAPVDSNKPCERWTKREQSCLSGVFSTAHRGMGVGAIRFHGQLWAEDTWQALAMGLKLGVCASETDYFQTRNGCIVSHHDPTLNRMTNRTGFIQRKSCQYVLGARNPGGARVATHLQMERKLKQAAPSTCFRQQELKGFSVSKAGLRRMVAENHRLLKSEKCVTFTSGMVAVLRYLHRLSPDSGFGLIHRSVYGRPAITTLPAFVTRIMIDYHAVTPDYVKRARRAGYEVSARNVDTPAIYYQMRREGVRVMVTDSPWLGVW